MSIVVDEEQHGTRGSLIDVPVDLLHRVDRLTIDFQDHITLFKSRLRRSGIRIYATDSDTLGIWGDPVLLRQFGRQRLE